MTGQHTLEEGTRHFVGGDERGRLLAGMPVTERRLTLTGISTAVLEGGDGPPVVLLHGPAGNVTHWARVIPAMARRYRVIAPDLPGHGSSEVADGTLDGERVLAWLGELIERTCASPPTLVGCALGGAIAARFAAVQGDRIDRLVLVDTLGLTAFTPAPAFGQALGKLLLQPSEHTHDQLWRYRAHDFGALRQRMGGRWETFAAYNLDRIRTPTVQSAVGALMQEFGAPAIPPDELARITVPTTLVWGRHDLATPLAVAEAASARYGWPLHVIESAGDEPSIEQPEASVAVLRDVIAPSRRAGGEGARVESQVPRREDTRPAWDRIAPGYDRTNTTTQMWLGEQALRRAGLRPLMRFLDVASGSGALSIPAARLGARVLATDQSPVMLELLRERAAGEGLEIETRVMDGQALELEANQFDMAGSQFGVMVFPDMPAGIAEMARVVSPGGRVLVVAYGDPHEIEFLGFFVRALQSVRPDFDGPPMDPPPLPFQLQDPERLRTELAAAGLQDVRVETITESTRFRSGEFLWDWLVSSNPIVESVLGELQLTSDEREVVRRSLDDVVRERAGDGGAAILTNPVNIGIGRK